MARAQAVTAHDDLARDLARAIEALDAAEDSGPDIWRVTGYGRHHIRQALARVEAELARLTADTAELRAALTDELDNWNPERRPTITAERDEAIARAEAAEARLARLHDGLRRIQGFCGHVEAAEGCRLVLREARALLGSSGDCWQYEREDRALAGLGGQENQA
jgi:hypothetical protein